MTAPLTSVAHGRYGVYAIATAVDGAGVVVLGFFFDRIGIRTMVFATVIWAAAAPLVFLGDLPAATLRDGLLGAWHGAQDPIMRATIARLAPQQRRETALGIMNAVYGVAWFAGSVLLGVLYDRSILTVVLASTVLQLMAAPIFMRLAACEARREGVLG